MSLNNNREEIYKKLVHKHADELYRFILRMCGDTEATEDILQETYYEAWRCLDSLRDHSKAKAWLFQISRHRYAHWIKDKVRRGKNSLPLDDIKESLTLSDPGILHVLSQQEILQKALDALDDRFKEPFLLVFGKDFTCKEVAEQLNVPIGTILSRVHRARVFLRKFVEKLKDLEKQKTD